MTVLTTQKCYCPYCGEPVEVVVDVSMGEQQTYIEDCYVCCRPILFSIHYDSEGGEISLFARAENE